MRATRIAVLGGLALLGLMCWLAARGFTALGEILITLVVLAAMVAGGNWLSGRAGSVGRAGPAGRGGSAVTSPPGAAGEERYCPGSELAAGAARRAGGAPGGGPRQAPPAAVPGAEHAAPEGSGPER